MFYEFNQNNSGGYFMTGKNACHRLIIEADTEIDAVLKAEELGCYWDGVRDGIDCPCCGDRWYAHPDEIDIQKYKEQGYETFRRGKVFFESIEQYAQYMANEYGWTSPDIRIFFKDRPVKEIYSRKERFK